MGNTAVVFNNEESEDSVVFQSGYNDPSATSPKFRNLLACLTRRNTVMLTGVIALSVSLMTQSVTTVFAEPFEGWNSNEGTAQFVSQTSASGQLPLTQIDFVSQNAGQMDGTLKVIFHTGGIVPTQVIEAHPDKAVLEVKNVAVASAIRTNFKQAQNVDQVILEPVGKDTLRLHIAGSRLGKLKPVFQESHPEDSSATMASQTKASFQKSTVTTPQPSRTMAASSEKSSKPTTPATGAVLESIEDPSQPATSDAHAMAMSAVSSNTLPDTLTAPLEAPDAEASSDAPITKDMTELALDETTGATQPLFTAEDLKKPASPSSSPLSEFELQLGLGIVLLLAIGCGVGAFLLWKKGQTANVRPRVSRHGSPARQTLPPQSQGSFRSLMAQGHPPSAPMMNPNSRSRLSSPMAEPSQYAPQDNVSHKRPFTYEDAARQYDTAPPARGMNRQAASQYARQAAFSGKKRHKNAPVSQSPPQPAKSSPSAKTGTNDPLMEMVQAIQSGQAVPPQQDPVQSASFPQVNTHTTPIISGQRPGKKSRQLDPLAAMGQQWASNPYPPAPAPQQAPSLPPSHRRNQAWANRGMGAQAPKTKAGVNNFLQSVAEQMETSGDGYMARKIQRQLDRP